MDLSHTRNMDGQVILQGNEKRAFWRSRCRNRLSEHILETIGLNIRPEEVRLKAEDDMEYAWQINDPSLEPVFQKSLSKHSVKVYMRLVRAVGHQFRAVPFKEKEEKRELDVIRELRAEIIELNKRLKDAEAEVSKYKNAAREADKQMRDQILVTREAEMTASLYQQNTQTWMTLSEWYRCKCLECSDSLSHMVAFLQQSPDGIGQSFAGQDL